MSARRQVLLVRAHDLPDARADDELRRHGRLRHPGHHALPGTWFFSFTAVGVGAWGLYG